MPTSYDMPGSEQFELLKRRRYAFYYYARAIEHLYFKLLSQDLVRRGIPHHFRGIAWQLLCDAHESSDKPKYADYMKTQSACEKVIRRDIARTYPEHEFFKKKDGVGQEALFNVMKAYSIHDREVGYCQGSGFIVGLLLMQVRRLNSTDFATPYK